MFNQAFSYETCELDQSVEPVSSSLFYISETVNMTTYVMTITLCFRK